MSALVWPAWAIDEANAIIKQLDLSISVPAATDILRFMELAPAQVRLVIIGQDPYPQPGVANGRAFAINAGQPVPGSLQTLFREIRRIKASVSTDETLTHWVHQGVLLLNMALTTQIKAPGAHYDLWLPYTRKLVTWLSAAHQDITWVLWGQAAQQLAPSIKKGVILRDAHPSPLSAHLRRGEPFVSINWIDW